jgi:hypothetical protein
VFAVAAVVATSLAQIYTSSYQKSLECDALQLLYHTSPIIAVVSEPIGYDSLLPYIYSYCSIAIIN